MKQKILILCVGNDLVADDGIGHAIYKMLKEISLDTEISVRLLGVGGMALIDELEDETSLIVADAVQLGAEPGTVHVLDWDRIPVNSQRPVSGHGIGVREALQVCQRLYPERVPENVYLVGVEGECFSTVGVGLSPKVTAAIPTAVRRIVQLSQKSD